MMFHLLSPTQTFVERSKHFMRGFLFSVHAYFNLVCPRHSSLIRFGYTPFYTVVLRIALDKREMLGDQAPSNIVWRPNILPFGHLVWCCLIKFEGHQTLDQKLKTFLLFLCLMGDVLFLWRTATNQTCFMRACVPRLLSGL